MAASEATKELIYLRRLLTELKFPNPEKATKLYLDNKAAIDLAYNPEHHQRTKHINRRHFFIREKVEEHELVVPFVKTSDNIADFFTKTLKPSQFFDIRNRIYEYPLGQIRRGSLPRQVPKRGSSGLV